MSREAQEKKREMCSICLGTKVDPSTGNQCFLCGGKGYIDFKRVYPPESSFVDYTTPDRCNEAITISDEWVLEGHEPIESVVRCELEQGHQGDHQYQSLRWHYGNAGHLVLSAERLDLLPHAGQNIKGKGLV